jgi:hypothetical protein
VRFFRVCNSCVIVSGKLLSFFVCQTAVLYLFSSTSIAD